MKLYNNINFKFFKKYAKIYINEIRFTSKDKSIDIMDSFLIILVSCLILLLLILVGSLVITNPKIPIVFGLLFGLVFLLKFCLNKLDLS